MVFILYSGVNCQLFDKIRNRYKRNSRNASIDEIEDRNSTSYIIGGSTAQQGAYPWTVRLEVYWPDDSNSHGVCGGALWNRQHVITAAHCLRNCDRSVMTSGILVCIGDYDQYDANDGQQCYDANQWWWNENYEFCSQQRKYNDIAVIRINNGMRVPYWGPNNVGNTNFAWAPNNNLYEGTGTFTGWGATNP
ncbi:Serine protease easter-like protein, partial [Leptotrombidium deliense]